MAVQISSIWIGLGAAAGLSTANTAPSRGMLRFSKKPHFRSRMATVSRSQPCVRRLRIERRRPQFFRGGSPPKKRGAAKLPESRVGGPEDGTNLPTGGGSRVPMKCLFTPDDSCGSLTHESEALFQPRNVSSPMRPLELSCERAHQAPGGGGGCVPRAIHHRLHGSRVGREGASCAGSANAHHSLGRRFCTLCGIARTPASTDRVVEGGRSRLSTASG